MCPHFHLLHEIFGTSASSRLPFQFSNFCNFDKDDFEQYDIKHEPNIFYDESENSEFSGEGGINANFEAHNNEGDSIDTENGGYESRYTSNERESGQAIESILIPAISMNETESRQRNQKRIREKYSNENGTISKKTHFNQTKSEAIADEMSFMKEKFEFEKVCRMKELDLKKYEIDSNTKLRIMQLEKEERMEKLKLELDYKVQIAKINGEDKQLDV